jgi:hypothetical protein
LQFASQEAPASGHRQSRPAGTQGRSLFSFEWEAGFTAFRHGHASIWRALFRGCWFPDAILHGKRSYRPRSRAVQRLAVAEILSVASNPDTAVGCATGLRTKPRHARGANSASWSFAPGRPPLLAMRWPEATGLTSYLSGCLALTSQRCGLSHRRRSGSFHRTSACVRILPGASPHFVRAFRRLLSGGAFLPARVAHVVLAHSSNHAPVG